VRRLPLLLALLLFVAACTDDGAGTTTTNVASSSTSGTTGGTPVAEDTTTTLDPQTAAILAEVEALIPVTEELRGLEFLEPPNIVVVSDEELEQRVRDLYEEELDPDETARDEAVYRLLGVIEEDVALDELLVDLFGSSVGGYYDLDTKELVVKASADGLTVNQRVIVVHELNHALTDQHFAHGDDSQLLVDEMRFDEFGALSAVVEGDSTRVESLYIQELSGDEIQALVAEYDEIDNSAFDAAPHFIQEVLIAPYVDGFEFFLALDAGNAGTDAVYGEPPISTEQVLEPEKYTEGESPIAVGLDLPVPAGYENGEESTWGATGIQALLGDVLSPGPLADAVAGWGGDRYRVLFDGTNAAFQLHWVGDTEDDLPEFAAAFEAYLAAAVDADDAWQVLTDGTEVAVIAADDPAVLDALVADLVGWVPWEASTGG
jgi:hypothetical protein